MRGVKKKVSHSCSLETTVLQTKSVNVQFLWRHLCGKQITAGDSYISTGVPGLSPGYSELWVQLPADVPGKQQIMSKVRARLPLAYQKEVRVPTQMSHQNSLSGWRHLSRCTRQGLSVPRGYLENGVSGGFEPLDAFVPTSTWSLTSIHMLRPESP